MSRSRALAALCMGVLLAHSLLPLVAFALAGEPAALCCAGGRCCCRGAEEHDGDGDCIRAACGCGRTSDASLPPLLRVEALLPARALLGGPEPGAAASLEDRARPLARPDEPSVPPPKPPLTA
jgi:hypothetical protein